MNITQTLESLSIQTQDDILFCELRNIIIKNFSKTIANKGKIISFYEESEIPQRKCFLKFIKKIYEKETNEELNLFFAQYKTIKINYVQKNAVSNMFFVDVDFVKDEIVLLLNNTHKIFANYIMQCFKDNENKFDEKQNILHVKIKNESDFDAFNTLFSKKEHLNFIIHFNLDSTKFDTFKRNFKVQKSSKFVNRFSALADLLEDNFETLGCEKDSDFEQIRQSYLSLVKIYHPDRHASKPQKIQNEYREKFEKIQTAYESLKPLFKTQENFVSA
ncbi:MULTISPECIES: adenylosuccinate lyase [Campylobacter]|uniref:Adenylosuccinate lyase n=1 Tax=Campylobacter californiensis TaxID=1032243 RepID=A0ABD4JGZ0_9BACT|nr:MULTISPECIES: adenylosuccinate lyase [unclassified Campylobacter]MBE2986024.1 adenylosuccinate lyase [Campylobacter sp. RM12919]MBE2988296.1 adenylosuccinate lyase [Campylobacter sp. RM12920]MBE3609209.1 adenylosuccinate lyase [Campylobacter sp. RM12916]